MLQHNQQEKPTSAPVYRALRLDDQGREIDEQGNLVVQSTSSIKTLTANLVPPEARRDRERVKPKPKKIENPYLAHFNTTTDGDAYTDDNLTGNMGVGVDERLAAVAKNRSSHLKKALSFVEQGVYTREEERNRIKEERKIIAGYTSGRKNIEVSMGGVRVNYVPVYILCVDLLVERNQCQC